MAVARPHGEFRDSADAVVGGGPCAIVNRRDRLGDSIIHGTCILQRLAVQPTRIDADARYELCLDDGRTYGVRVVRQSMSACGPEILRFEGPGQI
jgi:hypothetical protein